MMTKEIRTPNYENFQSKERTAISVLIGLRQKFALERKEPKNYTSDDLHKILEYSLKKINERKVHIFDTQKAIYHATKTGCKIVDEAIKKSKVKRYPWNSIFGESLTKVIHRSRKKGLSANETFLELSKNEPLMNFIQTNPYEKNKILHTLEISVNARYIESNTAKKVMEE